MNMISEHDRAVLLTDLSEHGLKAGDIGVVVMVHGDRGYEIEFMALDGRTLAVISLDASQVRPTRANEVPHARPIPAG